MSTSREERGVVEKLVIHTRYPNGKTKELVVDVEALHIEGLVWSDEKVSIVANGYKSMKRHNIATMVHEAWEPDADEWQSRPTAIMLNGTDPIPIPTCAASSDC